MGERRTRTELEALAFGADAAPDERAAALRALGYAQPPAPADLEAAKRDDAGSAGAGELGAEPLVPAGRRPGWSGRARVALGAGLVVGGAALGFAVAVWALGPAAIVDDTAKVTVVDRSGAAVDGVVAAGSGPSPTTDAATAAAQADSLLARSRTKEDVYPFPPDPSAPFIVSSSRLEATTDNGDRIWIARKDSGDGGYCLLVTSGTATTGLTGWSGCASPTAFGSEGVTMITDTLTVIWTGSSLSIEPGGTSAG